MSLAGRMIAASELTFIISSLATGDPVRNAEIIAACTEYIKQHPKWQLSLQTHKLIGFK